MQEQDDRQRRLAVPRGRHEHAQRHLLAGRDERVLPVLVTCLRRLRRDGQRERQHEDARAHHALSHHVAPFDCAWARASPLVITYSSPINPSVTTSAIATM